MIEERFLGIFLAFFSPRIYALTNFWPISRRKFSRKFIEYPNFQDTSDFPEYLDFQENFPASNTYLSSQLILPMAGQPHFNDHYKDLLEQLPPSIKSDIWRRLIIHKYNPLSEEQAGGIHPDIEELLTKEANRYFKKKGRQKIKIEANTATNGSNTLS